MIRAHHPALRKIAWQDLTQLSRKEIWIENTISLPWFIASIVLATYGYYLLALPCSFLFFLTGLRHVHNGFHYSLGISKRLTQWSLHLHSFLMFTSMHAVKYNHLRHHKHCMGPDDYEGKSAQMNAFWALLYGPIHIFQMHRVALLEGNSQIKRAVRIELAGIGILLVLTYLFPHPVLVYHLLVMITGECFSAFFAVWTVHHDCDEEMYARTLRSGWKNFLTYNMFYHLEHHLFPKVPTIKLPELARRIDEALPDLHKKDVC